MQNKELCSKTDVLYFPNLKYFVSNNFFDYDGNRTEEGIAEYIKNRSHLSMAASTPSIGYDTVSNKFVLINSKDEKKGTSQSITPKRNNAQFPLTACIICFMILSAACSLVFFLKASYTRPDPPATEEEKSALPVAHRKMSDSGLEMVVGRD